MPGRPFKKGQSGNPKGRTPIPEEVKEARKFNKLEVERVLDKFLGLTRDELFIRLRDPQTAMLERIVGRIILKASKGGDHFRLDFLLNRLIGKVKEAVEHSGKVTLEDLITRSREGENK